MESFPSNKIKMKLEVSTFPSRRGATSIWKSIFSRKNIDFLKKFRPYWGGLLAFFKISFHLHPGFALSKCKTSLKWKISFFIFSYTKKWWVRYGGNTIMISYYNNALTEPAKSTVSPLLKKHLCPPRKGIVIIPIHLSTSSPAIK